MICDNGKLENLSGGIKKVGTVLAKGKAGTYSTGIPFNKGKSYLVLMRTTNDNSSLLVTPIIDTYYNSNYIDNINGNIALILQQSWSFGYIYELY